MKPLFLLFFQTDYANDEDIFAIVLNWLSNR